MTFPASVQTVTLTVGPLYNAGGTPVERVPLTVRLGVPVHIAEGGAALPTHMRVLTGADGTAQVTLIATDSTGIDTTGFTYAVTCPNVTDGPINVALPAAQPTVAVESLVAVAASDGTTVSLPLIATDGAVAGLIADADSDTRAALEALGGGGGAVSSVNGETGAVSLSAADVGAAPALGADDNYVTDAEKAALHTHPAVIAQGATQADARTAIGAGTSSFSGAYADLSGKPTLGDAAAKNTGTTPGTVAAGDDSRMSDARTPTAHKTSHATGGSDALTAADIGAAATSHTHAASAISDSTTAGRALVTAADAAAQRTALGLGGAAVLAVGTTAGTVAAGDDSRFSGAVLMGAPAYFHIPSGYYFGSNVAAGSSTIYAGTLNRLELSPLYLSASVPVITILCSVSDAAATSVVRLGIYNSQASGLPGTVRLDAGTVDASTTGNKTITISTTLAAGAYWLAAVPQTAGCTLRADLQAGTSAWGMFGADWDGAVFPSVFGKSFLYRASVTGALPDLTSLSCTANTDAIRVALRRAE